LSCVPAPPVVAAMILLPQYVERSYINPPWLAFLEGF